MESITYCKGHGWQTLAGVDVKQQARECDRCTVRVSNL